MIRLQTCKGSDIPNHQGSEISVYERNWAAEIPRRYPDVVVRTGLNPMYKCFGLVFASRRTNPQSPRGSTVLPKILSHDGYEKIDRDCLLPGDLVLYFREQSAPTHAGIVVQNDQDPLATPIVLSKWGNGPEVVHELLEVPPIYGTNVRFYRCQPST